jgi:hypothetical protein
MNILKKYYWYEIEGFKLDNPVKTGLPDMTHNGVLGISRFASPQQTFEALIKKAATPDSKYAYQVVVFERIK